MPDWLIALAMVVICTALLSILLIAGSARGWELLQRPKARIALSVACGIGFLFEGMRVLFGGSTIRNAPRGLDVTWGIMALIGSGMSFYSVWDIYRKTHPRE